MVRSAVLVCMVIMLSWSAAHAEFFKWVDRDGREFYTNEREKIPAEYRSTAKPVEVHDERVSVERKPASGDATAVRNPEHKDRFGRGEEYWHKRAQNLRRQLREQQDDLDLIAKQERDEESRPKKLTSGGKGKKKKTVSAREKKKAKIERKIARLKQELDVELPEEARKADAYPGWLRE